MYYCKKCGAALTPEKRFCSQCGTPVEEITSTTQPTAPQAETLAAASTTQPTAPQAEIRQQHRPHSRLHHRQKLRQQHRPHSRLHRRQTLQQQHRPHSQLLRRMERQFLRSLLQLLSHRLLGRIRNSKHSQHRTLVSQLDSSHR